jgi:hypothetical protein
MRSADFSQRLSRGGLSGSTHADRNDAVDKQTLIAEDALNKILHTVVVVHLVILKEVS